MAASIYMPDVTVEIGFGFGYGTPLASVVWTDVSTYVNAEEGLDIARGRPDELADVEPSSLALTLDNRDGRFTPENAAGAYYPDVKIGVPIRVSAVWVLGGGGTTYRRYTGYVDQWPVSWPERNSGRAIVTVGAMSRMARLGRNAELRSVIEEEVLADSPTAYYTLGDPEGSTVATATVGEPLSLAGTGTDVTFGTATGPGTDSLTAATFAAGKILRVDSADPVLTSADTGRALEFWFVSPLAATAQQMMNVASSTGNDYIEVVIDSIGRVLAANGALGLATNGPATSDDGLLHHVVVRETTAAGVATMRLYIDGVLADTDTGAGAFLDQTIIEVGRARTSAAPYFTGTIAHVAVYATDLSATRIADHYLSGTTGFEGDSSDERIERIAFYAGVPSAEISTETGNTASLSFQDPTGQTPVEAMLDVVHTENGLLFDAGDGLLTFQSRGHRYGAASVLTLSATTQQIEGDLVPVLDDFGVTNDVTATNGATTTRVVNQTSIDDRGLYKESVDLLTTSSYEVEDWANYLTGAYGNPRVRVPSLSIQLIIQPSATITALLALELGDLMTISTLPSQAPAASMTFFVEGIHETIAFNPGESWLMTLNLSPGAIPGEVWILEVADDLGVDTILAY